MINPEYGDGPREVIDIRRIVIDFDL